MPYIAVAAISTREVEALQSGNESLRRETDRVAEGLRHKVDGFGTGERDPARRSQVSSTANQWPKSQGRGRRPSTPRLRRSATTPRSMSRRSSALREWLALVGLAGISGRAAFVQMVNKGKCYFANWNDEDEDEDEDEDDGWEGVEWEGMEPARLVDGFALGLLLDLDAGTLSVFNREGPRAAIRPPSTENRISRAVDGRFASFQACQPRRHIPRDDRGDFQRSNRPHFDSVAYCATSTRLRCAGHHSGSTEG
ncbi:hypothetical protein THAOC_03344, partial [Thalassiosira oceanica]